MSRLPNNDHFSDVVSSLPDNPQHVALNFPESFASKLPKRVLQWLYSFSLVIFMILTFAFIVVTPLDIVVQTFGSPFTGIKTLIVIGACAVFFVMSILLYFLRLYQSRVAVNQIPSKSVYIPLEKHDLPSDVRQYIEDTLRKCVGSIRVKAGPLHNHKEVINFPGMSPPEYIQQRNIEMGHPDQGTFLPPNCIYEDVVDSLGLKLRFDGLLVTNYDFPLSYSFREIVISMSKVTQEHNGDNHSLPNLQRVVELYEKFKFSDALIKEEDLKTFLTEFERLSLIFHATRINHTENRRLRDSVNSEALLSPFVATGNVAYPELFVSDADSVVQSYIPYQDRRPSTTSTRFSRFSTGSETEQWRNNSMASTSGSVIKGRLAMGRSRDRLRPYEESVASSRRLSGYLTDSEGEHNENHNDHKDDDNDLFIAYHGN